MDLEINISFLLAIESTSNQTQDLQFHRLCMKYTLFSDHARPKFNEQASDPFID